jgi:hypothetical protein
MRWVKTGPESFELVVAPLHGRGNVDGEGAGVRVQAYSMPPDPHDPWDVRVVDEQMHLTHNFELVESETSANLYLAGKEGVRIATHRDSAWSSSQATAIEGLEFSAGEVRLGTLTPATFIATIEPMHGTHLAVYIDEGERRRVLLDSTFAQGHALATGDLLGLGRDQIVAGWRNPNDAEKVGVKIYVPADSRGITWESHLIDDNTMACEDLKLADLDGDGKLDIIASGRASNNLKIYWNRTAP